MFASFFPKPLTFFLSALAWFVFALLLWHYGGLNEFEPGLSLIEQPEVAEGEKAPFLTPELLWNYVYVVAATLLFCFIWLFIPPSCCLLFSVCKSACG